MTKLIKHLKPFIWLIVAIFALLFGQAMAELSLPGYMANIVNVGIQQSGIENAVPEAMRSSTYDMLSPLISASDKAEVAANYLLLDKQTLSESDYAIYVEEFPALANETIYKLNTSDKAVINSLDAIFSQTIITAMAQQQGTSATPAGAMPENLIKQAAAAFLAREYEAIGLSLTGIQTRYILGVGGIMLLFTLLSVGCAVTVGFLSARVAAGLARNLRK